MQPLLLRNMWNRISLFIFSNKLKYNRIWKQQIMHIQEILKERISLQNGKLSVFVNTQVEIISKRLRTYMAQMANSINITSFSYIKCISMRIQIDKLRNGSRNRSIYKWDAIGIWPKSILYNYRQSLINQSYG